MTMTLFARQRFVALIFAFGLLAAAIGAVFPNRTHAAQPAGDIRPMATRYYVCAQTLSVRNEPGGTIIYGQLNMWNSFDLYGTNETGIWAYGFAYGSVNRTGWVMKQYLCQ